MDFLFETYGIFYPMIRLSDSRRFEFAGIFRLFDRERGSIDVDPGSIRRTIGRTLTPLSSGIGTGF
jgi:hypothetical protein